MRLLLLCLFLSPLYAQVDLGWQQLVDDNDYQGARQTFATAAENGETGARIGWFLTFTGNGPTPELAQAAAKVLAESTEPGEVEFVMKWMNDLRACLPEWPLTAGPMIENQAPAGPEQAVLRAEMLRLLQRSGEERPRFKETSRQAGFLVDWKVSERFGAYPIPAFENTWPAEQKSYWADIEPSESLTGVVSPEREAFGPGVVYAFTTVDNPKQQDVLFRVFSYQNVELYIDGKIATRLPFYETYGPKVRYLKIPLKPGRHDIIVKLTQTGDNNGQFSILLDAEKAITNLVPEQPKTNIGDKAVSFTEVQVGLAKDVADAESGLAGFIRAFLAMDTKDEETAERILVDMYQNHPNSQLLGVKLSTLYLEFLPYLTGDEQLGRAFQILSNLSRGSGPNLEAQTALALLLVKAKKTREALDLLAEVTKTNPNFCEALEARLAISRILDLNDVREETMADLAKLGEDHLWAQSMLLTEAEKDGNLERIRELYTNLASLSPWEGYAARLHEMNEDYEAAVEDFKKRWDILPERDFYPYHIAKNYGQLGDRAAQRQWLETTLEINPTNRDALLDIVNLDCWEGDTQTAINRLKDYLKVEPSDSAFRRRLSHLEGSTPFDTFRVSALEVIENAKNKPISKGADSELLLDQLMVRIFPDGSQMRYTHLVRRVLTKDGVDSESEIQLPGEDIEILELRTVKQDGTIFYPAETDHKTTISLTGVGIGDFIDEEHIEYLPPADYDENGMEGYMTFIFQGVDRIYHHSELVLIYPENLDPEPVLLSRNMPVEPVSHVENGLKYVRWLTKDMPPMTTEPAMAPVSYIHPTATFYYNTEWSEIRDFYLHAVRPRMNPAYPLIEALETYRDFEGSKRELAEKMYQDITDRIEQRGSFYQNINQTWASRTGNATLLLASAYKHLGFDCDVVLVQPAIAGKVTFDTPLPNVGYALLRLNLKGETIWLDPNFTDLPFGYVPSDYQGGKGLVLDHEEEAVIIIPEIGNQGEKVETNYQVFLKEDGSAQGMGAETFHGRSAGQLRKAFDAMNRPERKQRIEAGLNQSYPGAVVTDTRIPEEERGRFTIASDFTHNGFARAEGKTLSVKFPFPKTPLLERYGSLPSRQTPLYVPNPHFNEAEMTLTAPEGYVWDQKLIGEHRYQSRFGSYELTISNPEPRVLKMHRIYRIEEQFVEPEQYGEFLEFSKSLVENEDTILKASPAAGTP